MRVGAGARPRPRRRARRSDAVGKVALGRRAEAHRDPAPRSGARSGPVAQVAWIAVKRSVSAPALRRSAAGLAPYGVARVAARLATEMVEAREGLRVLAAALEAHATLRRAGRLTLHSLRLPALAWTQLEGQSYDLGNAVREITADGESHPVYDAYGSLKLGDAYHRVAPTLLRFGPRDGCVLRLHLEARLSATDAPPSFAPVDFAIDANVEIGPVHVVGDSGGGDYPSPDEAADLAARLLDVDAYEPGVVDDGCIVLRPRCSAH